MKDSGYRALAEFRYQIRRFLNLSEQAARRAGLEPQQHQMLLALKGLPKGMKAMIGNLAERLQVQHHSAVELVDRLVKRRLVRRLRGQKDRREVIVQITRRGEKVLRELSLHHRALLRSAGPALVRALDDLISAPDSRENMRCASARPPAPRKRPSARSVALRER